MKNDLAQRMLEPLDNPIWLALTTEQRLLARSHGLALRYPADVSPLAALLHRPNDAFADLRRPVSPGEHVALFTASLLDVPGDWQVDRSRWLERMICEASLARPPVAPLRLETTDVPEMLELTAANEPGPFLPHTIQMGSCFGIRASAGRLVAMAGERIQSTAFTEISAVCTPPEISRPRIARDLTTFLADQILAVGKAPFLHVKSENGAKVVYRNIGFRLRAAICRTVISLLMAWSVAKRIVALTEGQTAMQKPRPMATPSNPLSENRIRGHEHTAACDPCGAQWREGRCSHSI